MSAAPYLEAAYRHVMARRAASQGLHVAILNARAEGATLGEIAQATGLTKQRIHQITRGA